MADVICKCPSCSGDIIEKGKAFGCANWRDSDGGCNVTVWKNLSGKEITPDIVKQLLENKKTDVLDGFVSKKTGKPFSAKLVLRDDYTIGFEFPPREN